MNKLVEKELEKDLESKIDNMNLSDFEKRQKEFDLELKLLSEKLLVGVQPLIHPTGPVIQMIDLKE